MSKTIIKKRYETGLLGSFFGGHLKSKEEYDYNAALELTEELGIPVDKEKLTFFKIMKSTKVTHNEFQAVYLYETQREDREFSVEKDEIDTIEWFSLKKLYTILINQKENGWVHKPWDKEILDLITMTIH